MLTYLPAALLLLHGLIHIAGVFSISKTDTGNISNLQQSLWYTSGTLLILTALFLLLHYDWWWMPAAPAVVLSQVMIARSWKQARWGTVLNVLLLLPVIIAYSTWHFERQFERRVASACKQVEENNGLLTEADIDKLPSVVQRYIRYSGSLGKPKVSNFRVDFKGMMRKRGQTRWMNFNSRQYNFQLHPERLFFMEATMDHMPVAGFHYYTPKEAFMDIRLLSVLRVAYEKSDEMRVAETVTFFNDMCCMAPATLIDKNISWSDETKNSIRATFRQGAISIAATLYFNNDGALINFVSDDRMALQDDGSMLRMRWSTPLQHYRSVNGYHIAGNAQTIYHYADGDFCYGQFELVDVRYNVRR